MIKQFIRKILCYIDFWFYERKGKPLTKIKYFKRDVPNKYWGKCLLDGTEVCPYFLVYIMDPKKIKITERTREWIKKCIEENNLFEERRN